MLGRIIDKSTLRHHQNQGGTYFAAYMFLQKVSFAGALALGLWLSSTLGFDPQAAEQTAQGVFALQLVMAWLPATFFILSIVLWRLIPMDERRHAIIRKRLDQRVSRAGISS